MLLRCCAVGAVRAICEAETGFQEQLLALWCLHLGSLLHTDVAQPPSLRSQMVPLAWCPTVDSEQSSRVTDRRARCTDSNILAEKNQLSCMYFGPRLQWGLEGRTQMDPQLSPNHPTAWDSTWSPGAHAPQLPPDAEYAECGVRATLSDPHLNLYAALNHAGFLWLKLKCCA